MKKDSCQKWDSNPRPHKWTATWTQRLRPLGHPDFLIPRLDSAHPIIRSIFSIEKNSICIQFLRIDTYYLARFVRFSCMIIISFVYRIITTYPSYINEWVISCIFPLSLYNFVFSSEDGVQNILCLNDRYMLPFLLYRGSLNAYSSRSIFILNDNIW